MTPNRIQTAQKLIAAAEIQSISLLEAKLARELRPRKETSNSGPVSRPSLAIDVSHSGKATLGQKGSVRATVRFALKARDADKKQAKPAFQVAASFELDYQIPSDLDPSPQELRAFAETNAVFNAWPYWREFAQSMAARMNLPPLTLPLFRITPQSRDRRGTATQPQSSETGRTAGKQLGGTAAVQE